MPAPWTTSASASLVTGGPTVTVVDGSSFCISDAGGDLHSDLPQGLFFQDTRILSGYVVRGNGEWPETLQSSAEDPFAATFVARLPPHEGRADSEVLLVRRRYVGRGMREDVSLHNFGTAPTTVHLELAFEVDFADLFDVKTGRVERVGEIDVQDAEAGIRFVHTDGEVHHETCIEFSQPPHMRGPTAMFDVVLEPSTTWTVCVQVSCRLDSIDVEPTYTCGAPIEHAQPSARLARWRSRLPALDTEHDAVREIYRRSTEDLASLRIFDPDHTDRAVVAAGAPWFMTLFGRDSLLTSWMAMLIDSDLALGTLQTLAELQGSKVNPQTEEQPGRILHEVRFGDAARLSLGGSSIYYGSVDATPLFVMLIGELSRWGNKRDEVDALLPYADRALEWIQTYGDADGDGYIEYERMTPNGLRNQGWKDNEDAVRFYDGRWAEPPIALAEVQGYVYAAYLARALCAEEAGDHEYAARLQERARDLRERFNRDFWIEERATFAMALDREKQPVDAITSNIGHLLWTGIVEPERAAAVARCLMGPAMYSGWGVRTLATECVGYNPIGYHVGSIWPHDNAIIAAGLMRYGFVREACTLIESMIEAATHFGYRLPELFAGLSRSRFASPVRYPTSCSPQAWASAAPLLFLRTLLRLDPDLRRGRLHLAPVVPDWIGPLRFDRIPVLGGHLSIEVDRSECTVLAVPPDVAIVSEPRR